MWLHIGDHGGASFHESGPTLGGGFELPFGGDRRDGEGEQSKDLGRMHFLAAVVEI
jgi:hypothetical protein